MFQRGKPTIKLKLVKLIIPGIGIDYSVTKDKLSVLVAGRPETCSKFARVEGSPTS